MPVGFQYIICHGPGEGGSPIRGRHGLAYMAWQLDGALRLRSLPLGTVPPGGYMMLTDAGGQEGGQTESPGADCLAVCRKYGFQGLVCDFERPARRPLESFVSHVTELFLARGLRVYVPERYSHCHHLTRVLIPTALCAGSLRRRLREAVSLYGAERLALDMERLCRDIRLPSPNGNGVECSGEDLRALLGRRGGASFFSGELCAEYFTARDNTGDTHFYIYDDAHSFGQKAALAESLGIRQGFVLKPDAEILGL